MWGQPSDQVLYLYRRACTRNNESLMQLRERVREGKTEGERKIFPSVGLHHNDISCVEIAYAHLCLCGIRSPKANLLCSSLWSYIKVGSDSGFSPARWNHLWCCIFIPWPCSKFSILMWCLEWINLAQISTRVNESSTADLMNTLIFNIQCFIECFTLN